MKNVSLLFFLSFLFTSLSAQDVDSYLRLTTSSTGQAPQIFGNKLFFSSKPGSYAHTVEVVFDSENYTIKHKLVKNDFGTFTALIDKPQNYTGPRLYYRLIINGLWTTDLDNPKSVLLDGYINTSYIDLKPSDFGQAQLMKSYEIGPNNTVKFFYYGKNAEKVVLVGSFNQWDPYSAVMKESAPGVYEISLRLTPGEYLYQFNVDGETVTDSLNSNWVWKDAKTSYAKIVLP